MDRIDQIVEREADRLRKLEPDAVAIVVSGSYARGAADEYSDLDLRAIITREPAVRYRTWFAEEPGRELLHVSFGTYSVDYWLGASREPAWWALGFPVVYEAAYVWATRDARELLGADPSIFRPAGPPALEGLVECLTKVRRARSQQDAVGVLLYARKLAELTPSVLIPLNEHVVVRTLREALDAAVSLSIAPEHYREDLSKCLGLAAASVEDVGSAALRLTRELLAFLRERKPDVDPQPGVTEALTNGSFERHLGFLD
jgi:phosphoribosyl-AMP cyclohydrolase